MLCRPILHPSQVIYGKCSENLCSVKPSSCQSLYTTCLSFSPNNPRKNPTTFIRLCPSQIPEHFCLNWYRVVSGKYSAMLTLLRYAFASPVMIICHNSFFFECPHRILCKSSLNCVIPPGAIQNAPRACLSSSTNSSYSFCEMFIRL